MEDRVVIFRKPTKSEINTIVRKVKNKMKANNLNKSQLARLLNINYSSLNRVVNGTLTNYKVIEKLNVWINE